MKKNHFCFYLPSSVYGGTELLMLRLANYLADIKKYTITIYTAKGSFIERNNAYIKNNIIIKYDIERANEKKFIISSKYLLELSHLINRIEDVDFYIWQLQPIELINQFFPLRKFDRNMFYYNLIIDIFYNKRKQLVKNLLKKYNSNNQLYFMDLDNYNETNNYLHLELESPIYIPVAVPFNDITQRDHTPPDIITFCVISRLSYNFKYYPILHFLKSLEEYSKKKRMTIKVKIIGDGEAFDELKRYSESSSLIIELYGHMNIEAVYKEVFPSVNIYFGMGTSLIDSAKYSIPTIITNISNENTSENEIKYSLLYESIGYSLGSYENKGLHSLSDLLDLILLNPKKHGDLCFNYAKENHSANQVFEKLINNINKNTEKLKITQSDIINVMAANKFIDYIGEKIRSLYKK